MAGTLVIDTLTNGSGNSTSATTVIRGSAKAWVNFNGTTTPGTIRAQYNVSSVTRNSTADYTVNFSAAMADANYVALGTAGVRSGTTYCVVQVFMDSSGNRVAPTVSAFRLITNGTTLADIQDVCVAVFD